MLEISKSRVKVLLPLYKLCLKLLQISTLCHVYIQFQYIFIINKNFIKAIEIFQSAKLQFSLIGLRATILLIYSSNL